MEHNNMFTDAEANADYNDGYVDGRAIGYRNGIVAIMARCIVNEALKTENLNAGLLEVIAMEWVTPLRKTVLYDVTLDMLEVAIIDAKEQLDIKD